MAETLGSTPRKRCGGICGALRCEVPEGPGVLLVIGESGASARNPLQKGAIAGGEKSHTECVHLVISHGALFRAVRDGLLPRGEVERGRRACSRSWPPRTAPPWWTAPSRSSEACARCCEPVTTYKKDI